MKIGIGLFGTNGHQVQDRLVNHPRAQLVATAELDRAKLPAGLAEDGSVKSYATLEELLCDGRVKLVVLCSPRRSDQAQHAVRAMEAGKHVYAEKPAATREEDLNAIIAASRRTGCKFHEMAGTAYQQPYMAMRKVVEQGLIGTVVQVIGQKSYPCHGNRPQDQDVDGGLTGQAGVQAVRFVEHVAGVRVEHVSAIETSLGNPVSGGGLRMASCLMLRLANGGVASVTANYLNPMGTAEWGYDSVRIFGTKGLVESTEGGRRTRLVIGDKDLGPVDVSEGSLDYFEMFLAELQGGAKMPLELDEELHPTRVVIRARVVAR